MNNETHNIWSHTVLFSFHLDIQCFQSNRQISAQGMDALKVSKVHLRIPKPNRDRGRGLNSKSLGFSYEKPSLLTEHWSDWSDANDSIKEYPFDNFRVSSIWLTAIFLDHINGTDSERFCANRSKIAPKGETKQNLRRIRHRYTLSILRNISRA